MSYKEDELLVSEFMNSETKDKAFEKIVNKYKHKLYWYIRRMVVSHYDTDDILQNVFIKIWNSLPSFKGDSKLYTWLYRIATNESLNFLDKKKKHGVISLDSDVNDEETDGVTSRKLIEKVQSDENFDYSKVEWKLHVAIQKLSPQKKLVFNMRYFEELSYKEMEKILNVKEGALKTNYHLALKKIEDEIKSMM
ncbi:MAG: RNA polymerase sigma factor [Phycisphaerales bacterium]|nr:RNA polymerase sigma factor [Phycisphaerales bacterium]